MKRSHWKEKKVEMAEEEGKGASGRAHVVVVPFPTQGHLNPMLQFAKRLAFKGLQATVAVPVSASSSLSHLPPGPVRFAAISDGYDEGGFAQAGDITAYLASFRDHGSRTLLHLITKQDEPRRPVTCVVYDSFLSWALEVATPLGLVTAAFFTQPCSVNYIYAVLQRERVTAPTVSVPGLPSLEIQDMPSFVSVPGSYPAYFEMVLTQFSGEGEPDCSLVNTIYELESEVIDCMSKMLRNPLMAIGLTIPSRYLDKRVQNDDAYDVNLFDLDPSLALGWLRTKPPGSVVYASFGSLASLEADQMRELAGALKGIAASPGLSFLWVVRESEARKLPEGFEVGDGEGVVVSWCPQLEVLASGGVGCFLTHGGWNSTAEALSLGVPLVVMAQWTDQAMNGKLVEEKWGVGVRVRRFDERGVARKEEIERCVREVMVGRGGEEMRERARKWMGVARTAVDEGGSSDREIDRFVSMVTR